MKRYCELSGDTPDAVDKRLRAGHWLRDVHARFRMAAMRPG